MEWHSIYDKIAEFKIVPVIAIEKKELALPLADALIEGGLAVAEITFRTDAAAEVISVLHKQRPQLLIGAGTILNSENLEKARDCGAVFGVAPGFNSKVVEMAMKINFPFSPGIMTPSDIEAALSFGLKVLKFFPAEAAGGVNMLKSIAAPYIHLGVRFVPTGGINIGNVQNYLEHKFVLAVGGTWIAKKEDISAGNWQQIKKNCFDLHDIIRKR